MSTTFVDAPESQVRAGVARADVTPPVGIYHRMWGAARHDRSTGVHRPLLATALVLTPEQPDDSAEPRSRVWIGLDHCLLWYPEMQALLGKISAKCGLPPERITIFFSHTHAAGLMGRERVHLPGGDLIPPYLEYLGETLGELARQAQDHAESATITYGLGRCSLAANRDYFDEQGRAICGFNPDVPTDDAVLVGRIVTQADQRPLAVIVNYACHPTTLAYENTLISPDFVGAMTELVENAGHGYCLFVQGASGDVGPRHGFVGDPRIADRNGRQLGYAVLSTLESLPSPRCRFQYSGPVLSGATLGRWDEVPLPASRQIATQLWRERWIEIRMPYRPDLVRGESHKHEFARWQAEEAAALARGDADAAAAARAMAERATRSRLRTEYLPEGDYYPYRCNLVRLGDAVWVPLEGEHYNILQRRLRHRFPHRALLIGTVANGSHVWYLPDADSYGKGLYQEAASIVIRGSLERLEAALVEAIEALDSP